MTVSSSPFAALNFASWSGSVVTAIFVSRSAISSRTFASSDFGLPLAITTLTEPFV